jgi:hypothetical protein
MSNHAANPAATPFVSLKSARRRSASFLRRNDGVELPSLCAVVDSSNEPAILANFLSQITDNGFGPERASRFVSRLLFGHGFGAYPAPCGSASFCFGYAALRVMVPP